jgi:lysophospholipase L1-like esterase
LKNVRDLGGDGTRPAGTPKSAMPRNPILHGGLWLLPFAAMSAASAHEEHPEPLVTVYAVDPANPEISYDPDPYLRAPGVPEDPTVVYPESQTGALSGITDPYTALAPGVVTGRPDTYTLSPASVYYTPPGNVRPGPLRFSGVPMKFDFGPGPVAAGFTVVRAATSYTSTTGYGWGNPALVSERDRGSAGSDLDRDFCLPASGTQFYADVPDGHYRVTCTVRELTGNSSTTIRANGLPQLYSVGGRNGAGGSGTFLIRVENGRMMFEFFGGLNHINGIEIEPVPDAEWNKTTIFLASDSTVASYAPGFYLMGWGQPLHKFFDDDVRVDNLAQAGRSSKSFYEEGLLDTALNRMKPGDYLFVMFAINDSADDNSNRKTRPDSTFKAYLRVYASAARAKGAIPMFVPGQIKHTHNAYGQYTNSVQGYPQAMRELGAEIGVPVLDLNRESIDHLTAEGPPEGRKWYATTPSGGFDYIHLSEYGAHKYARMVSKLVRKTPGLEELAPHVLLEPRPQPGFAARGNY